MLDRVLRDHYKYVQCCFLCLIDGILEIVPRIFQTVSEELSVLLAGGTHTGSIDSCFDQMITKE